MVLSTRKIGTFFLAVICSILPCFQVMAQIPPTGGAAPINTTDENGISPLVFVVGGVAIGAAAYVLIKPKPVRIPVAQHLPNYLLAHNILPNEDALELMYVLNPELKEMPEIKSNKKLILPDFPPLNQNFKPDLPSDSSLKNFSAFESQREKFELSNSQFSKIDKTGLSNEAQMNLDKVQRMINEMNQEFNSVSNSLNSEFPMIQEFINDLMEAFNQTLDTINDTKTVSSAQLSFLQNILDNLSELVSKPDAISQNQKLKSTFDQVISIDKTTLIASINFNKNHSSKEVNREPYLKPLANTKYFAFAVYKYSENGELITKGSEVENRYIISYVVPALKDYPNYYKPTSNPASYANAALPPAILHIQVKDIDGNPVALNNTNIDFKSVYENPHELNENKMIVVPLYIKP